MPARCYDEWYDLSFEYFECDTVSDERDLAYSAASSNVLCTGSLGQCMRQSHLHDAYKLTSSTLLIAYRKLSLVLRGRRLGRHSLSHEPENHDSIIDSHKHWTIRFFSRHQTPPPYLHASRSIIQKSPSSRVAS